MVQRSETQMEQVFGMIRGCNISDTLSINLQLRCNTQSTNHWTLSRSSMRCTLDDMALRQGRFDHGATESQRQTSTIWSNTDTSWSEFCIFSDDSNISCTAKRCSSAELTISRQLIKMQAMKFPTTLDVITHARSRYNKEKWKLIPHSWCL